MSLRVLAEPAATCSICCAKPFDRDQLLGRGGGDGLGVAAGLAGGSDDRVERLGRIGAQLLDPRHRLPALLHLTRDGRHLGSDLLQQRARFAGRLEALRRQVAHLVRDDGEPLPFPPGPRRLDRGIQRDEVGEIGDLADRADEAGDPRW